jgi:hypothetical protein
VAPRRDQIMMPIVLVLVLVAAALAGRVAPAR